MFTRRHFLATSAVAASATALGPHLAGAGQGTSALPTNPPSDSGHYRPSGRFGLGGVAIGTGFAPVTAEQAEQVMRAAWAAGVRYFDTSPWYGLGLSERRMAHFLAEQDRDAYVISTKVGRLLTPSDDLPETMWKAPSPFAYRYDYTADGARRSIEDSLQRMGLSHLDIVFIHDLAPDHFGDQWTEQFEIAAKGAIPALTKMRDEGMIKAWGFGVNNIEPCLRALEVADPDLFLLATQYSIVEHEAPLRELFPKCQQRGVSIVVGAPFNSGFLAGKPRYNYKDEVPAAIQEKGKRISKIAREHGTDLRTAALQFCNAPKVVSAVIPGASSGQQVIENALSMAVRLPEAFWKALQQEKLLDPSAPVPS